MIWEFCKYCRINGKCENQDRGHKCETGYKILFEENQKLKGQLKECLEVLKLVAGETIDFPRTVDECIEKINLALEMLQNPENVTENVANQKA